jgi:hypothetical protein
MGQQLQQQQWQKKFGSSAGEQVSDSQNDCYGGGGGRHIRIIS